MIRNGLNHVTILKTSVVSAPKEQLLAAIDNELHKGGSFNIVTPNPEIVLLANHSPSFAKLINEADFVVPDGTGLAAAYELEQLYAPDNIVFRSIVCLIQVILIEVKLLIGLPLGLPIHKGRLLMIEICKLLAKRDIKAAFIGADNAPKAAKIVAKKTNCEITGFVGPHINGEGLPTNETGEALEKDILDRIQSQDIKFVFVGFGAPKQERWLKLFSQATGLPGMVVGGSFDYIASGGLPAFWENNNLEWLWRLLREPSRFARVVNAAVVFPARIYKDKVMK